MDLLETLEVDPDWLPRENWKAVKLCGRAWDQLGCPTERVALIGFLDQVIQLCVEYHLRYPKIFLKRLKQLQRHEWHPPHPARSRMQKDEHPEGGY